MDKRLSSLEASTETREGLIEIIIGDKARVVDAGEYVFYERG